MTTLGLTGEPQFERAKSLAEQVADTMVDSISVGHLRSGQRIFEADIARQYNVSRVPVREAMRILSAQGILEKNGARGLRVALLDDAAIAQLSEARLAIETIALRHVMARAKVDPAAARAISKGLEQRLIELEQQIRIASALGINHADVLFHRELCVASANHIVMTLWGAIARHVLIVMGRKISSESSYEAVIAQHHALLDAVLSGDEQRAARELKRHVMEMGQNVQAA